jgi:uncharacterized membrane protein/mono/diheme cytochrome c family protein
MFEHFQSMIEGLSHPPIRHAAIVHLPIALTIVALGIAAASAIMRKSITLRWLTFIALLALAGASFLAKQSGEQAEDFNTRMLPAEVHDVLEEHEDMGGEMWIFAAAAAALSLVAAITRDKAQLIFAWLCVAGCLTAMTWVSVTAHLGGTLVYRHSVGTPIPAAPSHDGDHVRSPGDGAAPADASPAALALFREQVQPILVQRCIKCHNPARVSQRKSGGLDQTSRETLLKGGRSGPAIVPGDPEASHLIHRIRGDVHDEDIMPPDGKLSDEQIAALEQWIRDGAVWDAATVMTPPPSSQPEPEAETNYDGD